MPIATRKPTAEPIIKPNIPKIEGVENNSAVVDTKVTPLTNLVTYVEGYSFVVNYYAQVLTPDSATYGQDQTQWAQYQQYRKIERLEIKIGSPLTTNQEEETKLMTVNGSGMIHSNVIANIGDMFVADVGDGREGVFQITRSEQKSIFKDAVYEVDFQLVYFSDDRKSARDDLESKVVQTLHYIKDFLSFGENPLISTVEFNALRELKKYQKQLVNNYFEWFFSNEFSTFVVPGQSIPTYDPFVVRAILNLLTTDDHPLVIKVRELNVNDDDYIKQSQLWDVLIARDKELLPVANEKMGLTGAGNFTSDPFYEGIYYSGLKYVVYPKLPERDAADHNLNTNALRKSILSSGLANVTSLSGNTAHLTNSQPQEDVTNPKIYPVLQDDYYVLSGHFYNGSTPKSRLEVFVENYLQMENNDPAKILELAKDARRWGGLERFYYIPLLLILIKAVLKEI